MGKGGGGILLLDHFNYIIHVQLLEIPGILII